MMKIANESEATAAKLIADGTVLIASYLEAEGFLARFLSKVDMEMLSQGRSLLFQVE